MSFDFEPPSVLPGKSGPVAVHGIWFDGDQPVLDNGVLHGRSAPERGIRFGEDAQAQGRGRRIQVVWIATPADAGTNDAPVIGVVTADYWVDEASRTGYKKLSAHTNGICAAAGGKLDLAGLSPAQKRGLVGFLERLSPGGWQRTAPLVKLFLTA